MLWDYTHPPGQVHQKFRWNDRRCDWLLRFGSASYGYAGFVFRTPQSFSAPRDRIWLYFEIKPARAAARLSVALVDGEAAPPPVLIDCPLAGQFRETHGGFATLRIPLNRFPDAGLPAAADTDQANPALQPFDWTDVREIRFIFAGDQPPAEFLICNLHFRK
jgi:hypothetical protein